MKLPRTSEGKIIYHIKDKKESRLVSFIDAVVSLFNKDFTDNYVITLGNTIYTPDVMHISEAHNRAILLHELQHIKDRATWGWFFDLSYLLLLPVFFTMRAHWEYRGYEWSVKEQYYSKLFPGNRILEPRMDHMKYYASLFSGPAYFFMWWSKYDTMDWYCNVIDECKATTDEEYETEVQDFLAQFEYVI